MSELTQEQLKQLLTYDSETGCFIRISGKRAGKNAVTPTGAGYFQIRVNGKTYLAHRVAWLYVYGKFPSTDIDHINGIGTDNRIINLRECTSTENKFNVGVRRSNTSGFKGVSWFARDSKWVAHIRINGRSTNLGYFPTAELASNAYQLKAKEVHGVFYREIKY